MRESLRSHVRKSSQMYPGDECRMYLRIVEMIFERGGRSMEQCVCVRISKGR